MKICIKFHFNPFSSLGETPVKLNKTGIKIPPMGGGGGVEGVL